MARTSDLAARVLTLALLLMYTGPGTMGPADMGPTGGGGGGKLDGGKDLASLSKCTMALDECSKSNNMPTSEKPITKEEFLKLCISTSNFGSCVDNLISICTGDEKPVVDGIQMVISNLPIVCSSYTANGLCNEALDCFMDIIQDEEKRLKSCTTTTLVYNCLKVLSHKPPLLCTLPDYELSFDDYKDLVTGICPEKDCEIDLSKGKAPLPEGDQDLFAKALPGMGNFTIQRMSDICFFTKNILDPALYCRMFASEAAYYSFFGEQCGLDTAGLENKHKKLVEFCPKAIENGARLVADLFGTVLAFLLALLPALF